MKIEIGRNFDDSSLDGVCMNDGSEIWFSLLEAAIRVANPYYDEGDDDAPGAFRLRVQQSFADLRTAIANAQESIEQSNDQCGQDCYPSRKV